MEEETMLNFFPGGLRVMIVDRDMKAARIATAKLSGLNYPVVATHFTPRAGLRALHGNKMVGVQAVICDVHTLVSSRFDFRLFVETKFHIPVIYLLSMDNMVADEDKAFRNNLLETATYIIKKPLDSLSSNVMAQLWKVVAWRNYSLKLTNMVPPIDEATHAGVVGGDDDDISIIEKSQVLLKAMMAGGSRKRQLTINLDDSNRGSGSGEGDDSSKPQKHRVTWTPCLERKFERAVQHIGVGAKPRKILEHMNVEGLMRHHISSHLQKYRARKHKKDLDERPPTTLRVPDSLFLKAILPTLNASPRNPLTLIGNAAISFNNNVVPAAVQAPAMGQKLYLGPFSYQGLPPPSTQQNHIGAAGAGGSLMAPPVEPTFSLTEPIMASLATHGEDAGTDGAVVTSEEKVAEVVVEAEPFMVPDQVSAPFAAE
ncbi:two-component response regulator ORR33-like [Oryza brachyantha]|uniref:HTH myb-type domain-containing protein n=1 Tax=Oryza brachyantha TaxID=4533 RepID=J3MTL3_ORYBR|nr:two-component response regulator ORR33-like [Oryza brachyantha]